MSPDTFILEYSGAVYGPFPSAEAATNFAIGKGWQSFAVRLVKSVN